MSAPVEISDQDEIHRLVDEPYMAEFDADSLRLKNLFEFQWQKEQKIYRDESVVWGFFAKTPAQVHQCGIFVEERKRERSPNKRYVGFLTATKGRIVSWHSPNGHGFIVTHRPEIDFEAHAHIGLLPAPNQTISRGQRTELKMKLSRIFQERAFAPRPGVKVVSVEPES